MLIQRLKENRFFNQFFYLFLSLGWFRQNLCLKWRFFIKVSKDLCTYTLSTFLFLSFLTFLFFLKFFKKLQLSFLWLFFLIRVMMLFIFLMIHKFWHMLTDKFYKLGWSLLNYLLDERSYNWINNFLYVLFNFFVFFFHRQFI